jgi:hypothetical protein
MNTKIHEDPRRSTKIHEDHEDLRRSTRIDEASQGRITAENAETRIFLNEALDLDVVDIVRRCWHWLAVGAQSFDVEEKRRGYVSYRLAATGYWPQEGASDSSDITLMREPDGAVM